MGFAGVYVAVYDYEPRAENELEIKEGDLLYVIEKSSVDDWWKAKRKATPDEEEEPEGLVPNNYVEEAHPISNAKALYDYTRQTDEEVSFAQDADLAIYDTSDPDWTLVRVGQDYGFAPANYIEVIDAAHVPHDHTAAAAAAATTPTGHPQYQVQPEQAVYHEPEHPHAPVPTAATSPGPAAALADILHGRQPSVGSANHHPHYEEAPTHYDARGYGGQDYHQEEAGEEHPPALPQRPVSIQMDRPPPRERDYDRDSYDRRRQSRLPDDGPGVQPSPPYGREGHAQSNNFPSGYHLYNISESITVMGKKKKMPTTLGINVNQGMILISTSKDDDKMEQWSVDKMTNYSIEGKHVFLDLVRPSRSIDFHAGAKDTAQEIVSLLGEIAGRYRAEGLKEVIEAGKGGGKKRGVILYDFDAQGDDEVSVCVGDEVIILDDQKSDEWWMVRRLKNGREGVVPSSYIEITAVGSTTTGGASGTGMTLAEQSRLEEERLAREAVRKSSRKSNYDSADGYGARTSAEVGIGPRIPRRRSSLSFMALNNDFSSQRSKKESKSGKSKPDPSKLRKWTDVSGTFNVKAQFTGLVDGKIHLHKENGVKIAVPVSKMSIADIEYVESVTGVSLDEDKPLSAVKASRSKPAAGAAIAPESNYDWFDFFLKAGVPAQFCERYAQNFIRDSMDESVLPDITTENLRTLGLKEGDILRVMKYLDKMFDRTGSKSKARSANGDEEEGDGQGGLFSGPGGTLHNNTRKSRPAPAVVTSDTVDPKAFESKDGNGSPGSKSASPAAAPRGFDDDAWEIKKPAASPSRTASPATSAPARSAPAETKTESPAPPTGALADLSLLQTPLQPTPAPQPPAAAPPVSTPVSTVPPPAPTPAMAPPQPTPPAISQPPPPQMPQPIQAQPTGANPAFFSQLSGPQQQPQPQPQQPMPTQQQFMPQMTGYTTQSQPMQPQMTAMMPPPPPQMPQMTAVGLMPQQQPPRPLSAPQNPPQPVSAFGPMTPLQPQMTGAAFTGSSMMMQQRPQPPPPPPPFQPQSAFGNAIVAQQTGMPPQQTQSQFGMQPTGFQPQPTGFQPQPTGFQPMLQPQPTGYSIPPPPPLQPQPTTLPLTPQKTGPAPPVRFGVQKEKLQPQPTGLRANLAQATPSNPFGF